MAPLRMLPSAPRALARRWPFPRGSVVVGKSETGRFGLIHAEMRARHLELVGATGQGKTVCLDSMSWQDIVSPDYTQPAVFQLDPHGVLPSTTFARAVSYGIDRFRPICVLDPCSDPVFGLNILRNRPGMDYAVIAAFAADAVAAVWQGEDLTAKPQLKQSLMMIFWTLAWLGASLLEAEELADISDDNALRAFVIDHVPNRTVRRFWRMIEALPPAKRDEKLGAAIRRLSDFLLPASISRIFATRDRVIDFRTAMDDGLCLLFDLSYGDGRISKDDARLLGAFILNDIFLSARGRPRDARPVYIYIDEVQLFMTDTVAAMLDQCRKWNVHLIISHQHPAQLKENGEAVYHSVLTNTRSKLVFGGLDDEQAIPMVRNIYRGTFDLEWEKTKFNKPVVTGQVPDWMLSESDSRGTAHAVGSTYGSGGSEAKHKSTTKSESITVSETDTVSESETISESDTESESHTRSLGLTASQGTTRSASGTASSSRALASSRSEGTNWSAGTSRSDTRSAGENKGNGYRVRDTNGLFSKKTDESRSSRNEGISSASARTDGVSASRGGSSSRNYGETDTTGYAATRGVARSDSLALTAGVADTEGRAHTSGTAYTTGTSHSTGIAQTEGTAETQGTTSATNWSQGGSTTDTVSRQHTNGRSQTLRSVYQTMPTQAFSLDEQVHLRSVELANLDIGEAVLKVGNLPPQRLQVIRFREGWARPEHIAAAQQRIAAAMPFMTPIAQLAALYVEWRRELGARIAQGLIGIDVKALDKPEPPALKDEEWG